MMNRAPLQSVNPNTPNRSRQSIIPNPKAGVGRKSLAGFKSAPAVPQPVPQPVQQVQQKEPASANNTGTLPKSVIPSIQQQAQQQQTQQTQQEGTKDRRRSLGPQQARVQAQPIAQPQPQRKSSMGAPGSSVMPQPTTSRQSIAPNFRQSGIGVKSRPSVISTSSRKQETRPITTTAFKLQEIQLIQTFLQTHSYPQQIKNLHAPSKAEFIQIVQFLAHQLDPSISVQSEDEVINFFKVVKYPFNLSKKQMQNVGSPHTWPQFLAAVAWVVELLNYQEVVDIQGESQSDENSDRMFFEFNAKAYIDYFQGRYETEGNKDDFNVDLLQQDLINFYGDKQRLLKQQVMELRGQYEAVKREQELYSEDIVGKLSKLKSDSQKDVSKFEEYIVNASNFKTGLETKLKENQQELDARNEELASVKVEFDALEKELKDQKLTPPQVEKILHEQRQLAEYLHGIGKKKDEIGRAIETKEVDFSRKLEEVERVIMDFNTAARNAQLIPSNAKYAKGVNFMLQFNAYSPEDTAEHIKTVVKPKLEALRGDISDMIHNIQDESAAMQDEVERAEEIVATKKDEYATLKQTYEMLEVKHQQEKQNLADQLKQKSIEIQDVNIQINKIKEQTNDELAKSQAAFEAAQLDSENTQNRIAEEREVVARVVVSLLESYTDYKTYVRTNLQELESFLTRLKHDFAPKNGNKD